MHLVDPVRSCIDEMIHATGQGMKAMVLDDFTTSVIGVAYGRSEMLLREVYLIEYIDSISKSKERLNSLRCIVILRPTKDNIQLLCQELENPHYRSYHLYFTNRIGPLYIEKLAKADEREVVRVLKEIPIDYYPITPFSYHLKLTKRTFDLENNRWKADAVKRVTDGLISLFIALQVHPLIRYDTQSQLCKTLAEKVSTSLKTEYKQFKNIPSMKVNSLLLILDRRIDLITPIIHSWFYGSMIHEQFDVTNNCINLEHVPNRQPKDPKEMLLSIENDHFFRENYNKGFGDLGPTILRAVENLKTASKSQAKVETLADMKRFIEEYPETKRYATDLHNHVFLMTELGRISSDYNLMTISEIEQEIACGLSSYTDMLKKLTPVICSSKVRGPDAIRLVCLFALCYPDKSKDLANLVKRLRTRADITKNEIISIQLLQGLNQSRPRNTLDDTVQRVARKIKQGVKGVDNVLTEFSPYLSEILNDIRRNNKSRENDFAFYGPVYREESPSKIIVYVVGGFTYDEALLVDRINRTNHSNNCDIVIGGDALHNFNSFVNQIVNDTE